MSKIVTDNRNKSSIGEFGGNIKPICKNSRHVTRNIKKLCTQNQGTNENIRVFVQLQYNSTIINMYYWRKYSYKQRDS